MDDISNLFKDIFCNTKIKMEKQGCKGEWKMTSYNHLEPYSFSTPLEFEAIMNKYEIKKIYGEEISTLLTVMIFENMNDYIEANDYLSEALTDNLSTTLYEF